jgi:hypothetical protein
MARFKYLAVWLGNGGIRLRHALGWTEHSALARATKKVAEAHRRAMLAYKPNPYDGKMVQLMCGEASHRAYEDRRLAWSSLAPEGFEVRIVPGNHLTMVEDPHVRVLAQELQSCLDRASNAGSRSHTRDMLGSRANIQDIKARRAGHLAYRFSRPLVSRQFSDRAASRVR